MSEGIEGIKGIENAEGINEAGNWSAASTALTDRAPVAVATFDILSIVPSSTRPQQALGSSFAKPLRGSERSATLLVD